MRAIIFTVVTFLIASCSHRPGTISATASGQADMVPGDCPYLTRNNSGETVMSWVKMINDSASVFCYAVSADGNNFGAPVEIPTSKNIHAHSENLPKIIFKPSGDIVAMWGAKSDDPRNKYSGLIYYSQSFDNGKTWTASKRLVNDPAGYDQRYADIALLKNGEVGIVWLDNRKTTDSDGSGVYYAVTKGRDGFQNEKLISQQACQCCRSKMFVDAQGNIHALYRGIMGDSIRDMTHIVSKDGGNTFSAPARIHNDNWVIRGCPHTGPSMTENSNGLQFAWYTGGLTKGSFFITSKDNGATYTSYDSISSQGSHPQITCLPDNRLVIAWDESCTSNGNFHKQIGLQLRGADGRAVSRQIITPDSLYATYPVVSPVSAGSAIVAYCVKRSGKNYINYQKVSF